MQDELQGMEGIFKQGFGIIAKLPMRDKRLSAEAKAIYAYICSFAGAGGTAFPSVSLICDELGMSENRFHKHRKQLEELGYIKVSRPRSGNRMGKNVYEIVGKPEPVSLQNVCLQNEGIDDSQCLQNEGIQNQGTNNNTPTGCITNNNNTPHTPQRGAASVSSSQGSLLSEGDSVAPSVKPEPRKGGTVYSDDFEAFWAAYPRHIAKAAAYKAWQKAKKSKTLPELSVILDAVKVQADSEAWKKDGGQYIPHPSTWLNQERWADEVQAKTRRSYAPDSHGRRAYVRESEMNYSNMGEAYVHPDCPF